MELTNTIRNLRAVILDPECRSMNKSTVVGFLGELLVRKKLLSEGAEVKHLGNQKGYDLRLSCLSPEIRIDVKTAVGTEIIEPCCRTWGWALFSTSKKRPITCTHFVCVALDGELEPFAYHVILKSNVTNFPPSAGQFKSVLHAYGAHYPHNPFSTGTQWWNQHDKSEQLLNLGLVIRVDPDSSLLSALRLSEG